MVSNMFATNMSINRICSVKVSEIYIYIYTGYVWQKKKDILIKYIHKIANN